MKSKYGEKAKLRYCILIAYIKLVYIKTEGIYVDIAKDLEKRFFTSNYELQGPLPKSKNQKVIVLMKDDLGGKIMKEFAKLQSKKYSYLTDDNDEN